MSDQTRIAEVLGEWFERQGSAEPLDPGELIARHPDIAHELRVHFGLLEAAVAGRATSSDVPETLGGYRIEGELGSGGMGSVYRARTEDGSTVALKLVHPHLFRTPGFFKRFLREADLGRRVEHDNVVRTLDVDAVEVDGRHHHFLVMEYVEGQTLRELLDDLERVPEELCRHIAGEICAGLTAIHVAGAVHRDIKPENVLITSDHHVKVMDLGVARLLDEAVRLSQTGAFVGSVDYAAPEQFGGGKHPLDGRADLHALGVLLYELSTGRHPFSDADYRAVMRKIIEDEPRRAGQLNPQLSPFFEELVQRLLAKSPGGRFDSADALAAIISDGERSEWWRDRAREMQSITKRPLRRIRIPRETAVYGRDEELQQLFALFEHARTGTGQALLLKGEAGIGKTRLVDEFVARLQESAEDVNVLFGSYPPSGASAARGALSTAFREHLGDAGSGRYLERRPLLAPGFDAILNGEPPPRGATALTAGTLATAFVEVTHALAAERPTIIFVDDLHFASEDARGLFLALALAVATERVLLIGSSRPGLPEEWLANATREPMVTSLELQRLGGKDLADLLVDAFQSERLAEELAFRLLRKSDGNPFFVFEIIRGLRDGQFLAQGPDGSWHTTRVIEEIEIPSSVLDLVNARVADLSESQRNLLDVAACCGFEFDPSLVAAVIGLPRIPALQALAHIEKRHRLVRSAGRSFVFDHHQVQEALEQALPQMLREEYHMALAGALECVHRDAIDAADLDGNVSLRICEHLLDGAAPQRAVRYLDAAQAHLESGHLHDHLIRLTDRMLEVPGLLTGAARGHALRRLCVPNGSLDTLGRRERQERVAEELAQLGKEAGSAVLREAAARACGVVFLSTGRVAESEAAFRSAVDFAQSTEAHDDEGAALVGLGNAIWMQGRLDEARVAFHDALAIFQGSGNRRFEANTHGCLGNTFMVQGRLDEAREYYERHLEIAREVGDRVGEGLALGNLGNVHLSQNCLEDAERCQQRYLVLSKQTRRKQCEMNSTGNLGTVYLTQGRTEDARVHLERYADLSRELGNPYYEGAALTGLAMLAEDRGDMDAAVELTRQGIDALGNATEACPALIMLGERLRLTGDVGGARRALEQGLALARERDNRGRIALALATIACLPDRDDDAVPRAQEAAETAPVMLETWFSLWLASRDPTYLTRAKDLLDEQLDKVSESYHAGICTNRRIYREILAACRVEFGDDGGDAAVGGAESVTRAG